MYVYTHVRTYDELICTHAFICICRDARDYICSLFSKFPREVSMDNKKPIFHLFYYYFFPWT